MAQLKDTVVSGSLRATNTLYATTAQFKILKIPSASNGTSYTAGSDGQILRSNGSSVYWDNANNHTHSYLSNTNTGGADRPIYITGNAPAQTTYRMAATNVTATTALSIDTNFVTGIWYVNGTNTTALYSQADGVAYVNKYNDSWIHEIYGDYRTGQIAVRGKNNGTWQAWRKILDSENGRTLLNITNVENTRLSTWTGTTNISTVGIVTSGVWNGTPIAANYIGSHTHSGDSITGGTVSAAYLGTMTGATATTNGASGAVPKPTSGKQSYYLRGDGTWQPAPVLSVGGLTGAITLQDLGITGAMHYRGTVAAVPPTTGTYNSGDVVVLQDTPKEYVYDGTNWRELGTEGSFKTTQTVISKPAAETNKWVSSIGQDANGEISVSYSTLITSGTWSGTAGSANALNFVHTNEILIGNNNANAGIHINHRRVLNGVTSGNTAITDYYFKNGNGATTGVKIHAATFNGNLTGNVTGNVTGDVTGNVSGSAGTAAKFTSAQSITLTGDTTGTASSQAGWSIATTTKKISPSTMSSSLGSFIDDTALIYGNAAGSNTTTDKPTSVDAYGVLSFKTAGSYYGQILISANNAIGLYWRTGSTLSGSWRTVLDSSNYSTYAASAGHTHSYAASSSVGGSATYADTTVDTSNVLYAVGVTSAATTTLKRDTSITFGGGTITATKFSGNLTGDVTGTATTANNLASAPSFSDGGSSPKTFSANTTYTLTVGGKSVVFKTPADSDTKNTAGSTNSTSKLYLIGATSQAANPTTNSYSKVFETAGALSAKNLGINADTDTNKVTLQWNASSQSVEFIFA